MSMPPKIHDPKPRLGKEEVEILEREFQRNPKPSTQVKRQYAEEMAVDLPRINNWFQNRRAKRKQERKQEEASQAQAQAEAQEAHGYSEPSSPDLFNPQSIFDGSALSPQRSIGSFSTMSGPAASVVSFGTQYTDLGIDSIPQNTSNHEDFHNAFEEHHDGLSSMDAYGNISHAPHFNGISDFSYDGTFISTSYDGSVPSVHATAYNDFPIPSIEGTQSAMMTAYPSQLLPGQMQDLSESHSSESSDETPVAGGYSYSTTESEAALSPPGPSQLFKPPQPMDIASRRKVHNKPAALGTETIRSRPAIGPRTVSHADGIRRHTDSPHGSPMRRINSAGGNSRNVISGRVNKSGVESSQRSPINLGGFASTEAFIEHNQHGIRYPLAMTAPSAPGSSLAPPTPMSPHGGSHTVASTSPSDSGMGFVYNTAGCYNTAEDQNLASPPETPQAQMIMHAASNGWTTASDMHDQLWDMEVPDEPIYTPAHESFLELQMPQPMYLSSLSQPVTPAFGQFSPSILSVHGSPQYTQMPGQTEYPFVEPQHYSTANEQNSSSSTGQKTFHFSNSTPADFSEK
ncbi:hypothetical protein F5884DRAFT_857793 [Xylogone sp. PMI_703]|nr:hypothetical protein F5884DRAFT_857793 [Xylogone sp. PMI_703]